MIRTVCAARATRAERLAVEKMLRTRFPATYRQDWTDAASFFCLLTLRTGLSGVINIVVAANGRSATVWNFCAKDAATEARAAHCLLRRVQKEWGALDAIHAFFSVYDPRDIGTRRDVAYFRQAGFRNRCINPESGLRMTRTPVRKAVVSCGGQAARPALAEQTDVARRVRTTM
jgi:hypothetical protein